MLSNRKDQNNRLYPHRDYDPIKSQFGYVPVDYSLKKMKKLFVDYTKPYKTNYQILRDYLQPFIGLAHLGIGLLKMGVGLFTLNRKRLADGFFTSLRGLVELITSPIAYLVKPIMRYTATLAVGLPKIENNKGIQELAQRGTEYLEKIGGDKSISVTEIQELSSICNDLHRKFTKAQKRQQYTHIDDEKQSFETANRGAMTAGVNKAPCLSYFSLFNNQKTNDCTQNNDLDTRSCFPINPF